MRQQRVLLVVVVVLVAVALWSLRRTWLEEASAATFSHHPQGIMGTSCQLVVVASRGQAPLARQALLAAESELRRLEALMSTWIESSQLSRLNRAPANTRVELSREVLQVLERSRDLYRQTTGAFDITARPLVERWRRAGREGVLPTAAELANARASSRWEHVTLDTQGVVKKQASTRFDVDGIAKGYAVDRALETLWRPGFDGAMVEIGGDLRVAGVDAGRKGWQVAVRSPFEDRPWVRIRLADGAVCTSGSYARFLEIGGRRYSHVLDPLTGRPAERSPSVTVVAPDAATADAWATALSVLGSAGLALLDDRSDLEALIVNGEPESPRAYVTSGFHHLVEDSELELLPAHEEEPGTLSPTSRLDRPSS